MQREEGTVAEEYRPIEDIERSGSREFSEARIVFVYTLGRIIAIAVGGPER